MQVRFEILANASIAQQNYDTGFSYSFLILANYSQEVNYSPRSGACWYHIHYSPKSGGSTTVAMFMNRCCRWKKTVAGLNGHKCPIPVDFGLKIIKGNYEHIH